MTAPAKPWRVAVPQLGSTDWETREAAYEHAQRWLGRGHHVVIRRWEDGSWRTVEHLQPEPSEGALFDLPDPRPQGGPLL
ncbi:hypothetical protein [Streptosporangium sandarakinum]